MIVFEGVTKVYEPAVVALSDVTFLIEKGEFVFIVGASGSGKSTLVRLLLKELEPTQGKIIVGGRDLGRLKRSKVPMLRRNVGCVFRTSSCCRTARPPRTSPTRSRCRARAATRSGARCPR